MTDGQDGDGTPAARIAAAVGRRTVVAAESVTAGAIGQALAAAPEASRWLSGSILAYRTPTKRTLLGVTAPRVITAECAEQMARGALALTGADVVIATTGVGGPDPEEGRPAGTVFLCVGRPGELRTVEVHFGGDPAEVVDAATARALELLADELAG